MIKDLLVSFKDNFKEKSTNPFLGTYVVVWLIRNWDLVYSLFNFDKSYSLAKKIEFIQIYYSSNDFLEGVQLNILWAFGVLIATYTLINISRLIINLYEKQLTPWIIKITDSDSIIEKSSFDKLKNHRDYLQNRLEQERESKSGLELQIKSLEDEIKNLKGKDNLEGFQKAEDVVNGNPLDEPQIMYNKIKEKGWVNDFLENSLYVIENKGDWLENEILTDRYKFFLNLGLFEIKNKTNELVEIEITSIGKEVLKKARLEYNDKDSPDENTPITPGEIVNEIFNKKYDSEFQELLAGIPKSKYFSNSALIDYLSLLGVIEVVRGSSNEYVYKLTPEGILVRNIYAKRMSKKEITINN